MENSDSLNPASASALSSGEISNRLLGHTYELGLFMFVLTASDESQHFDIGKEVKIADKFDDLVIREPGNEYTCYQAKLEENPELDRQKLDPDVLIARKPLHEGGFNLLKYFVSYLRITDQFKSDKNEKTLMKLIIFTNTKLGGTSVRRNDIQLVSHESTDTVVRKTHSKAQHFKIKKISTDLTQYLTKYLKSDAEILSAELIKYCTSSHQLVYGKGSKLSARILKYYYYGLVNNLKIIKHDKIEGKFTENFVENRDLEISANNFRTALIEFIEKNTYGKVNEEDLKRRFEKSKFPVFDLTKCENHEVQPSDLLLQAFSSYIIPAPARLGCNTDYFKYYHSALIQENVIVIEVTTENGKEGKFSQSFIDNDNNLSPAAKKLRALIPESINSHAQKLEKYFKEAIERNIIAASYLEKNLEEVESLKSDATASDPQYPKESLKNVSFLVSSNFGQKSGGTEVRLPNYDITQESMNKFIDILEFRLNELGVTELFQKIQNDQIKDKFLKYYALDPEYLERIIRNFVQQWKNAGNSASERWILDSQREEFVQKLEINLSRCMAEHKTREYEQDLEKKIMDYDIHFDESVSFQDSYFPPGNKIFLIKTDSILLSSIKMLNYLKKNKLEGYIFLNVESLMKKEEIRELIKTFKDDAFNHLILSYKSLDNDLKENLFHDLSKIFLNHPKRIFLITSASENVTMKEFKCNENQFKQISDKNTSLAEIKNPLKILEREVIFLGEPTALNKLVNQDDINLLKLINAKTLDEIFKNEPIRIGCRPLATSDLPGAYAQLSEEVNKETLLINVISNSSENIFVIGGILFQDKDRAKKRFIHHLGLSQRNDDSKCDIILKKMNILTHPYSEMPTDAVIQLVDSDFEESHFKEFCSIHSEKRVFWVRWDETNFKLHQIYDHDFYTERKFDKVTVKKKFWRTLRKKEDQFVFSGVSDSNELAHFLEVDFNELIPTRVFLAGNAESAKNKFNQLRNTVHWLQVESNDDGHRQIVWRSSKGSLQNLRECIDKDHSENSRKEIELLPTLQDKQAVIIADDPGMGKSTTLVKLYGLNKIVLTSHWIVNVNLRDHLQTIRDIRGTDINVIKQFMFNVTPNLDKDLSRNLLAALCTKRNLKKPLLITFDGFDEILDEADRMKVISLLTTLKQKTCTKFWVTTRLQYQVLLEDALCTFSITFKPLDELEQRSFIVRFFRDRLRFLVNNDRFLEIFGDGCKMTSKMYEYTDFFIKKMKSVFLKKYQRFIGTPLQLNLLLGAKGSVKEFQNWAEASTAFVPNFTYIGENVLKVYENFISGNFEMYSKRAGIKEEARQNYYFEHWLSDCKCLAKSIYLPESDNSCLKHKAMVLAPGLIKSHDGNLEFIHSTFGEYFVSEVFVRWIEKNVSSSNSKKQKKLVKDIFMNDNYQVIRWFINARLSDKLEDLPQETFSEYEKIIRDEFYKQVQHKTPLHMAANEGNENITAFLCRSVNNDGRFLREFVAARDIDKNALHVASKKGYTHVVKKIIEPFANDVKFLKELLLTFCEESEIFFGDDHPSQGWTALHLAAQRGHVEIVETLLERFSDDVNFSKKLMFVFPDHEGDLSYNDLGYILPNFYTSSFKQSEYNWTALHLAADGGHAEIIEKLLLHFKDHEAFLKSLLKYSSNNDDYDTSLFPHKEDQGWTALHRAALHEHFDAVEKLIAPFVSDKKFFDLVKIPTEYRKSTVLHFLACHEKSSETIKKLLEPFTNDKRAQLIKIQAKSKNTALHYAAALGHEKVIEQLLSYFTNRAKEKLIRMEAELGKTVFHLAAQSGCDNTVGRLLDHFTDKSKCITMEDSMRNSSLHIAAIRGHSNIVDKLLDCAKNIGDNWKTFERLVEMSNKDRKTAFDIATNTVEIEKVVKKFFDQAHEEKAPPETTILLSKVRAKLSSNPQGKVYDPSYDLKCRAGECGYCQWRNKMRTTV